MQANKASEDAKEQLQKWLQKPNADHSEISKGARADLNWLQSTTDLSAVSIEIEKPSQRSISTRNSSQVELTLSPGGGSGGGGILSLFGCASRRK